MEELKKKNRVPMIAVGIILIAAAVFIAVWRHAAGFESTDDAFIDSSIAAISAKVSNKVAKVYVQDNQIVKSGQALLDVETSDFVVALEEARAKLLSANAAARRSSADLSRYEKLAANDEITQQQLDTARADKDAALARVRAEEALVKKAELNLSYTKVLSPIDGRVTKKSVEAGNFIQTGQTLMAIVPETVWVTANFKETQLTHMAAGQKVSMKIDAYPGHEFRGKVESIQSGTGSRFSLLPPENATGNYVKVVQRVPVKIVFDGPIDEKFRLVPGMSVVPKVHVR